MDADEAEQLRIAIQASLALEAEKDAARRREQLQQDEDYAYALQLAQQFEDEEAEEADTVAEVAPPEATEPSVAPQDMPQTLNSVSLGAVDVVDLLPTSHYIAGQQAADSAACAVCQCDYERGDTLLHLPCLHAFHEACVAPWLRNRSKKCPVCKMKLLDGIAGSQTSVSSAGSGSSSSSAAGLAT